MAEEEEGGKASILRHSRSLPTRGGVGRPEVLPGYLLGLSCEDDSVPGDHPIGSGIEGEGRGRGGDVDMTAEEYRPMRYSVSRAARLP